MIRLQNWSTNKRSHIRTSLFVLPFVALLATTTNGNELGTNEPVDRDRESHVSDEDRQRANELVNEALSNEIYGDVEARNSLLSDAIQLDPENARARWQLGYVLFNEKWVRPLDLSEEYLTNRIIEQYHLRRDKMEDTVEGNLEVAQWCEKRRLHDQEKAHLFRVIQIEPDHAPARMRLGFRRIDGEWVAAEDILASQEAMIETQTALQEWQPKIANIRERLHRSNLMAQERAERELLAIHDPEAIPAIEAILSTDSEAVALLAVQVISQMNGLDASSSLARHAVFSDSQDVRRLAALQLRDRELDEFVPQMLAEMQTPLRTIQQVLPGRGRRLVHRTVVVQENQDQQRALVDDTVYHRRMPIGDSEQTWERARQNMGAEALQRTLAISSENLRTEQLNERLCEALSISTDQKLPAEPQAWWEWWNEDNDILIEGSKTLLTSYQSREVELVDSPLSTPTATQPATGVQTQMPEPRSYECLVRGSLVSTAAGLLPIESIKVGDLVLAKDVDSGELGFRAVLRTTTRPSGPTMKIELHDSVIQSSLGHPFWVSGEGWVKAKDLKSGMELHTADGCVRISNVSRDDPQETFNLVIDGFASYFVGSHRVLSHDHTMPAPTKCVIPGLAE